MIFIAKSLLFLRRFYKCYYEERDMAQAGGAPVKTGGRRFESGCFFFFYFCAEFTSAIMRERLELGINNPSHI